MYQQVGLDQVGIYTLIYCFLSLCFVVPPKEVAAAGITIQNLFAAWLGDETINFMKYHIKRTSLTLFIHSLLPLGYGLMLMYINPKLYLFGFFELSLLKQLGYAAAISLPFSSSVCIFFWSRDNWMHHPLTQKLKHLMPTERNHSVDIVAGTINAELRRPNLFNSGHYSQKVRVTDNWIVKVGTYTVDIVHQANCVLSLHSSEEHTLSEESPYGVQILQIDVRPVDNSQRPFSIRLNSVDYGELRAKLQAPLVNARNVVVRQTVTEQFTAAFADVVGHNIVYNFSAAESGFQLESCLACMQATADVKLVKLCAEEQEGECRQCYCRPLWCLACLSKWFSARQDQSDTSRWLSGTAGCPMCRAVFCVADVCKVRQI
ncbi:E3 ubiquitin-protein ligase TM129-like [Watersipora subatra]|uniref:E3 ubiquitin-protein ligase TM129-like n=1 Tax=Watersipora subatra TaxID=2589382 RepID=UPI00355B6F59